MKEDVTKLEGARWVLVAEFGLLEEARLLAGRLDSEGIPAMISPDYQSEYYGRGTSALFGNTIKVYIPENRVLEARRVIDELDRS